MGKFSGCCCSVCKTKKSPPPFLGGYSGWGAHSGLGFLGGNRFPGLHPRLVWGAPLALSEGGDGEVESL